MSLVDRLMNRLQRESLAGGPTGYQWQLHARPGGFRVEAVTRGVAADPDAAWLLALGLRDGMVAEGFELVDRCRVGVTGDAEGSTGPPQRWRGWVDIGLRPAGLRWPRQPLP